MTSEWIKSPTARRVLGHWADSRPAWLWSGDGETLLWRNASARYFHGRVKKHGVKLAPEAVPIRGQIARLIRLGSQGRSSLSRIQFLSGGKPVSTTCAVTPLPMQDGEMALLIVGVDPIEPELLGAGGLTGARESFLPDGSDYLLIDENGQIVGGTDRALDDYAPTIESEGLPEAESATLALGSDTLTVTRFKASPQDAVLLLFEGGRAPTTDIAEVRAEEGLPDSEPVLPTEPLLPIGLPPAPEPEPETPSGGAATLEEHWVEPFEPKPQVPGLANLFDRLADDEGLYAPLSESDDTFAGPLHENVGYVPPPADGAIAAEAAEADAEDAPVAIADPGPDADPPVADSDDVGDGTDVIAAVIEFADDEDDVADEGVNEPEATEPQERPVTWRVTGRGFLPLADEGTSPAESGPPTDAPADAIAMSETPDNDTVERVSRYNFDELSRILSDRVATESAPEVGQPAAAVEPERPVVSEGSLVNLAAETFVLNRLPIGILVFRDQQVLFANRALTDLVGYESVEGLRGAGLAAIFPNEGSTAAGPVTQLMRRDGQLIPVRARLQAITWQGRPGLMLSAMTSEDQRGHEGAVRSFAEIAADAREEGFLRTDRSGVITHASLHARVVFGKSEIDLIDQPLVTLIDSADVPALRAFLEQPARFAESARPSLYLRVGGGGGEILLFAEGQAGVVGGYFAFVRGNHAAQKEKKSEPATPRRDDEVEPSMLGRLSRGIRRPLNTIIGFADLIRSSAFGTIENARYLEYARDIKTAGAEIATLVDELDDYARLREGRYAARPAELDLGALLESCVVRVRGQAALARVLVRSAISERLPHIRADRASLGQAVLNLLASAIDQTPPGGSVILSAQFEDSGAISVNVRDSAERAVDPGDRFVVFRDGVGKDGEALAPVRSTVGLALTRSLLAVNTCSLSVDPSGGIGTLFSLLIPADLVADR